MKQISIIGTVGVPAKYGGFETLVENLIDTNIQEDFKYHIYCSKKSYTERKKSYKGANLIYIPLKANGKQSILYDIFSMIHASFFSDILLILGSSGSCFFPILRLFYSRKIIINIDGLEHNRGKWGKFAKWFLKLSEKMAVKFSDIIVTDNKAIQEYVLEKYEKKSVLIEYGGDHVIFNTIGKEDTILDLYYLKKGAYCFTVCRIEPENNIHFILEAFKNINENLVLVGNWDRSAYGLELLHKYKAFKNIKLLSPIYDICILNVLRENCKIYIHGHSAGGTNPSLVEAMFFSCPIVAFDVVYNRETTENKAIYFKDTNSLVKIISMPIDYFEGYGKQMIEIAKRRYTWDIIRNKYNELYK